MIQKLSDPVSVQMVYDHLQHKVNPQQLLWHGKVHKISQVGLHHTYRDGQTLIHIFSVTSLNLFFRLKLDTSNLFWTLEEISDGLTN